MSSLLHLPRSNSYSENQTGIALIKGKRAGHRTTTAALNKGSIFNSTSVTTFGEISRLWRNFKIFAKLMRIYLVFGKKIIHFGKYSKVWVNLFSCKWPHIEQIIWPSGNNVLSTCIFSTIYRTFLWNIFY